MHFSFGSLQLELGVKSTSSTSFIGAQASGGKLVSSKLVAFGQDQVGTILSSVSNTLDPVTFADSLINDAAA